MPKDPVMSLSPDVINALVAGAAFIFSVISLGLTMIFNRQSKQADVLGGFNDRFDRLQESRAQLLDRLYGGSVESLNANESVLIKYQVKIFFDRFWSLQFDEFVAWQKGLIPRDIYRFWLFARWHQLNKDTPDWNLGEETVSSSLAAVLKEWSPEPNDFGSDRPMVKNFIALMTDVRKASKSKVVDELIERHAPDVFSQI